MDADMDNSQDRIVRSYMERVLALQREREREELSDQDLERIALEAGLGPEDIAYARKRTDEHRSRGKGFMKYRNWRRAADEFEQVAALSPNSVPVLLDLAISLWNHGVTEGEREDRLRAVQYAERALQLEAGNTKAIRLVTHMTEYPKEPFGGGEELVSVQSLFEGKQALPAMEPTADEAWRHRNARRTAFITLALSLGTIVVLGVGLVFLSMPGSSSDHSVSTPAAGTEGSGFARQVRAFGSEGSGPGRFTDARHIGTDGAGNIYVGEYGSGRVQMFDPAGTFLTQWNVGEDFPVRSMAVSREGTVFVVMKGAIRRYDGRTGKPLGTIDYEPDPRFDDVALMPDGGVVAFRRGVRGEGKNPAGISDTLVVFDRDGTVERTIELGIGEVTGGVASGVRVAADGAGNIYALDPHSGLVFRFGKEGRFLNRFAGNGDGPGELSAANGIAADGKGRVYVSDFKGVHVFDPDGLYRGICKTDRTPFGIAFNGKDEVLIAVRDRVEVYRPE